VKLKVKVLNKGSNHRAGIAFADNEGFLKH
jgi:hypothetical protein